MSALNAIWLAEADDTTLVPLREHVIRLCFAADEIERRSGNVAWAGISSNLHMAASLTNVEADTDLRGGSFMCSAAADYEDAATEITRKHLAGVIVFNLCWTAYESAVEIATRPLSLKNAKGARGRDLLRDHIQQPDIPYLRSCLEASAAFFDGNDPRLTEFRSLFRSKRLGAAAAELMRHFRNEVVHGALGRPEPGDWGPHTDYHVDQDPVIIQFRHHVRLVLILSQIIMAEAAVPQEKIASWSGFSECVSHGFGGDLKPAPLVLRNLHHNGEQLPLFPEDE